ncbi:Protein disulfide-isomerase A4 [Dermatophagoides pteronyssinus]|uniref:Protein disulfide-isomerase n=1 Tax=Dermatophagoides pteronyssinus TaxID=6956 RepID=A0ABQ8JHR9_DERPT|nr:Protein disulfide-isomerase A4 [Dermatophagoides pteronyssinus]
MKSSLSFSFYYLLFLITLIRCDIDIDDIETITVENYVYVLDDRNYDSFVQQHPLSLIEFYAPWCGHCKALAPEFSKAAKILQDDQNRVVLAKIDASKFSEFTKQHNVSGFPTLFIYRNGTRTEYDGPRTSQGIADYMREISDPNYKPIESVITLTSVNFDDTIKSESLILVQFYAPWCGHCKRLKPEYERAARRLQELEKPIKLAKVDATAEQELAQRFEVKGYPTLFIFRNGKKLTYKGPRDENGIVDFMKEIQKVPSKLIESKEMLRKQIKEDIPTIVGFFDTHPDEKIFDLFIDVAYDQFDDDNYFVHIANNDLVNQLKQKPNSIAVFYPLWFRSKYESNSHIMILDQSTSVQEVVDFIRNHSIPLVGYRYSRTYSLYANRYPLVVVYYDVDFSFDYRKQTQMIREQVLKAAAQIKKTEEITFVIAKESENEQELKDLKLDDSGADVNVGYFESAKRRYAMEPADEFNDQVLIDFVLAVRTGKINPVLRSQPIPKENPVNNLWTVVGETFQQLVIESKQHDIMLQFYAPWCGHCKALMPIYQELAKKFEHENDRLRIMKIDASSNDFPEWFDVNGFPTIYYIRRDQGPRKPILYQGDRKLEDLNQFIQDQLDRSDSNQHIRDEL